MIQIKWREYTWYSKLAALIFFVLVLPGLTFYIGVQYEKTNNYLKEIEKQSNIQNNTKLAEEVLEKGCYTSVLRKDKYTFEILGSENGLVSGRLSYNNYEKDSSSGAFLGVFKDNILLGEYSSFSEGSSSIRQVIFKKINQNLMQGYGPMVFAGDKEIFDNTNNVVYDQNTIFSISSLEDCK